MRYIFALLAFAAVPVFAQAPVSTPGKEVVFFSFHNARLEPPDYTFQLSQDCAAIYTAKPGKEEAKSADNDGEREAEEENESGEKRAIRFASDTCKSIFDLAKTLGYLKGDFEYRKHKVAYTGDRTLGYFAPGISNKTSFTFSENPQVQQLAAIFEGTAATLEAEPKLKYLRRYDRLGLNEALKGLEGQAEKGWLRELQLLVPELESIANDTQVMNIARQRAQHLLQIAQAGTSAPPTRPKK
jgi:hypothetical protein